MNENIQLGNKKREENSNCNPPFDKNVYWMPVGQVLHNDSPKNSGFEWSGNFSQPPSAIGDEDLNSNIDKAQVYPYA